MSAILETFGARIFVLSPAIDAFSPSNILNFVALVGEYEDRSILVHSVTQEDDEGEYCLKYFPSIDGRRLSAEYLSDLGVAMAEWHWTSLESINKEMIYFAPSVDASKKKIDRVSMVSRDGILSILWRNGFDLIENTNTIELRR